MSSSRQQLEDRILSREWFYEFPLPNGKFTRSYLPEFARSIHTARMEMLFDFLNPYVGDRWPALHCLDLACHEGLFALKLALKGCQRVVGLDARREHLDNAALIREIHGLANLTFVQGDVQRLDTSSLGVFDIVLAFGILYHVHDLVGALRSARAVTGGVCLIETQIAPELDGNMEWGAQEWTKSIRGCLALVDEADDLEAGIKETGLTSVSLVPSLRGLLFMLERAGFERTVVLEPKADAHEQHRRGKRVIVAAFPTSHSGAKTPSVRF